MRKHTLVGAVVLLAAIAFNGCGNNNKNNKNNDPKGQQEADVQQVVDNLAEAEINILEQPNRMLLIVDPQNDFVKDGSLATKKGAEALDRLANALKTKQWENYRWIIVTMDAHPEDHCSFKEQGGDFPPHCVQGTPGMAIYDPLWNVINTMLEKSYQVHLMEKGYYVNRDEFSIFQNAQNGEKLRRTITEFEDFIGIDVCGIATDYCVYETVKDLVEFYPAEKIRVVTNCIAAVDESDTKLANLMKEKGIKGIEF